LDRSGSMASISDDVVGGFNTFLAEQRKQDGGGRVTLVQFDGQDPFEILIDGEDLDTVGDLDPARYIPRGNTPLYDAIGLGPLGKRRCQLSRFTLV
ncbi:MAG: VWA domain-containing protein, partial [Actinobacteria bacterium]|nr:VWA domain-containing protein [Actinomycetota bacterium]